MTSVGLVTITPDAESMIAEMARVSSDNPQNPEYEKLIGYLITHSHWSPFEMAHCVMEIETSRAIAAQILRHRSFSFQEFSQRYSSNIPGFEMSVARKQAVKNRQASAELCDDNARQWFNVQQQSVWDHAFDCYTQALENGVAREQARMLLPLMTTTKLYMSGSVRSWIHYCNLRCKPDTQQEHRQISEACREVLAKELPTIAAALGWS